MKRLVVWGVAAMAGLCGAGSDVGAQTIPGAGDSVEVRLAGESWRRGEKSPAAAVLVSLLGTAIPVALTTSTAFGEAEGPDDGQAEALVFLGGLVLGPSLGHFYAERPGRALVGIGVRGVAVAAFAGAVAAAWDSEDSGSEGLAVIAVGLGAGAVVWDIAGAAHSARAHNADLRSSRLRVEPAVGRSGALGVKVAAAF